MKLWKKAESEPEPLPVPAVPPAAVPQPPNEERRMEKPEVTLDLGMLVRKADVVGTELDRFAGKLNELIAGITGGTAAAIKPNHPAVRAVLRASRDVDYEMKTLRNFLMGK